MAIKGKSFFGRENTLKSHTSNIAMDANQMALDPKHQTQLLRMASRIAMLSYGPTRALIAPKLDQRTLDERHV